RPSTSGSLSRTVRPPVTTLAPWRSSLAARPLSDPCCPGCRRRLTDWRLALTSDRVFVAWVQPTPIAVFFRSTRRRLRLRRLRHFSGLGTVQLKAYATLSPGWAVALVGVSLN